MHKFGFKLRSHFKKLKPKNIMVSLKTASLTRYLVLHFN